MKDLIIFSSNIRELNKIGLSPNQLLEIYEENFEIGQYLLHYSSDINNELINAGINIPKLMELYKKNPLIVKDLIIFSSNIRELNKIGLSPNQLLEIYEENFEIAQYFLKDTSTVNLLKQIGFNIEPLLSITIQNPELVKQIFDEHLKIKEIIFNNFHSRSPNFANLILASDVRELKQLLAQEITIDQFKVMIKNKASQGGLSDLLKHMKEIGLKPVDDRKKSGLHCDISKRKKRDVECKKELVENEVFPYDPLEGSNLSIEQRTDIRSYSQASIAIILQSSQKISNKKLKKVKKFYENVGELINADHEDRSPREQDLLEKYIEITQNFSHTHHNIFKQIRTEEVNDYNILLYDNGQSTILVMKYNEHFILYSPDLNYKTLFQARRGISQEYLTKIVNSFFKWQGTEINHQIYTLSEELSQTVIVDLQQTVLLPQKFRSDPKILHINGEQRIEGIALETIYNLFAINNKNISFKNLKQNFFEANIGAITFRVDNLHKVLPHLNADEKLALFKLIQKYDLPASWSTLDKFDASTKQIIAKYSNLVINGIKDKGSVDLEMLQEFSWSAFKEVLMQHPDINPALAHDITSTMHSIHTTLFAIKEIGTNVLFLLPNMLQSYNSGQYQNLIETGIMTAGDHAVNTLLATLTKHLPKEKGILLSKLPITSPIFKAMTIYLIKNLYDELAKLPADSPEREVINDELNSQYATVGLMIIESLAPNIELAPVWIILMVYQLISGAQDFAKIYKLNLPFIDELAMSLGFEADTLSTIIEERSLVEAELMVPLWMQDKIGLKMIKIPYVDKIEWVHVNEQIIPPNIRLKLFKQARKYFISAIAEDETYKIKIENMWGPNVPLLFIKREIAKITWSKKKVFLSPVNSQLTLGLEASLLKQDTQLYNNWFLKEFVYNNTVWNKVLQTSCNMALYLNKNMAKDNPGKLQHIFFSFDPQEGDATLDIPNEGLVALDQLNYEFGAKANSNFRYNDSMPYIFVTNISKKTLHHTMEYQIQVAGQLTVKSDSMRVMSAYIIDNNTKYFVNDLTNITKIQFINTQYNNNNVQYLIDGIMDKIFITKLSGIMGASVLGIIQLNNNKKYLQINLGPNLVGDDLMISAEQLHIFNVQGYKVNHSILRINAKIFKVTLLGNIIINDKKSILTLNGLVSSDLPLTFLKHSNINNIDVYTIKTNNIDAILESLTRDISQNTPQIYLFYNHISVNFLPFLDLTWTIDGMKCKWNNAISASNIIHFIGKSGQYDATLTINYNQTVLTVLDQYSLKYKIIKHYQFNNINIESGAYIEQVFNHTLDYNHDDINKKLTPGTVLKFKSLNNALIYHNLLYNTENVTINGIIYQIVNNQLCAIDGQINLIDTENLLSTGSTNHFTTIPVNICFNTSLINSSIYCNDTGVTINGIQILNVSKYVSFVFNQQIIPAHMVLLNCCYNLHNHLSSKVFYNINSCAMNGIISDNIHPAACHHRHHHIVHHKVMVKRAIALEKFYAISGAALNKNIIFQMKSEIVHLVRDIWPYFFKSIWSDTTQSETNNTNQSEATISFDKQVEPENANSAVAMFEPHKIVTGVVCGEVVRNSDGSMDQRCTYKAVAVTESPCMRKFDEHVKPQSTSYINTSNDQPAKEGCYKLVTGEIGCSTLNIFSKECNIFANLDNKKAATCSPELEYHNIAKPMIFKNEDELKRFLDIHKSSSLFTSANDNTSFVLQLHNIYDATANAVSALQDKPVAKFVTVIGLSSLAIGTASLIPSPIEPIGPITLIPSAKSYINMIQEYLPMEDGVCKNMVSCAGAGAIIAATTYNPYLQLGMTLYTIGNKIKNYLPKDSSASTAKAGVITAAITVAATQSSLSEVVKSIPTIKDGISNLQTIASLYSAIDIVSEFMHDNLPDFSSFVLPMLGCYFHLGHP